MSRRFGRNQRRRAREQVAALEQTNRKLDFSASLHQMLATERAKRLVELEQIIADARRILGPFHVALPIENYEVDGEPRDFVEVLVPPAMNMAPHQDGEAPAMKVCTQVVLHVLGLTVVEDMVADLRHARVYFAGNVSRYAITRRAMAETPRDVLFDRTARHLAHDLAREFGREEKTRYGKWWTPVR